MGLFLLSNQNQKSVYLISLKYWLDFLTTTPHKQGKPSTATLKAKRQYLDETDGICIEMDFECTADCDGAKSAGGFDEAQFIVGSTQIAADKKYKMSVGGAEQTQKMAAAPTPSGRRLLTTAASADVEGESGEEEVVVTPAPTAAPPTADHDHDHSGKNLVCVLGACDCVVFVFF